MIDLEMAGAATYNINYILCKLFVGNGLIALSNAFSHHVLSFHHFI